jgi:hypothetical protein
MTNLSVDAALRQRLIQQGIIVEHPEGHVSIYALATGTPVLRLDHAGKKAVAREMRENGARRWP